MDSDSMVYPKLCQSMTKRAPRQRAASHATNSVGMLPATRNQVANQGHECDHDTQRLRDSAWSLQNAHTWVDFVPEWRKVWG